MDTVSFDNSRGVELVGNFYTGEEKGVVLAHSFTGDRTEQGFFLKVARELHENGFGVLAFDFSGCGDSGGESIGLEKQVDDLEAAKNFMLEKGFESVGIFGYSLGGLIALKHGGFDAYFLTSPPTKGHDFEKRINAEMEPEGEFYRLRNRRGEFLVDRSLPKRMRRLDQDSVLEGVNAPVKLVHGEKDSLVPVEDSESAAEKLGAELHVMEEMGHVYRGHVEEVAEEAFGFFEKHL